MVTQRAPGGANTNGRNCDDDHEDYKPDKCDLNGSRLAKKKLDDDFHRRKEEDENDNDDENDNQ